MAIHLENDDKPVDLAVLYQIIRQTYLARLILPRQLWNEETTLELTNNIQPNDTTWYNMIYIIIIHNHTWWTSWYSVRRNFKPNQGKTSPNIIMTSSTNITPYSPGIKHGLPKKKPFSWLGDSHVWGQSSLPLGNLPSPGSTKALFGSHPVDLMLDIGAVVQDLILAPAQQGLQLLVDVGCNAYIN
jgi:hypothetical protein